MSVTAAVANRLWLAANLHASRRFASALTNATRVQEARLRHYLQRNARTAFGRRFGFTDIRTVAEFQARVPVSTYDDYGETIDRIARGEDGLLTADPVRLLEPSSGTTRAAKLIPYTASLQAEFRRAIAPWVVDLFGRDPSLMGGPAYWAISPALDVPKPPGVTKPVGFDDDSSYLGGMFRWLVNSTLAVPGTVRNIRDADEFRQVTLLLLLTQPDLRLISIWHPTFLTLLHCHLREHWDVLLRQVTTGLRPPGLEVEIPPNPSAARRLASADPSDPSTLWPHLGLISCWGDGHAAYHIGDLARLFPDVRIQSKGLIATEAIVSIPYRGRTPLAITSHFFEFLDDDGRAHLPSQLEVGRTYSPVVTTGGGLYRYRLHDLIVVTEFLGQVPSIRFLGKEDHVSDAFGEKLSDGFVAVIIARVLNAFDIDPTFAMLAPERTGPAVGYVLFVHASEPNLQGLAVALEAALQENPHYAYCIRLGQLVPARVMPVGDDASSRYLERLRQDGRRLGSIKVSALSNLFGWSEVFGVTPLVPDAIPGTTPTSIRPPR